MSGRPRPAAPREIAFLDTPGAAIDVEVAGNIAYVADGNRGVRSIDVSNPRAPRTLGPLDTPGPALDLELSGHLLNIDNPRPAPRISAVE